MNTAVATLLAASGTCPARIGDNGLPPYPAGTERSPVRNRTVHIRVLLLERDQPAAFIQLDSSITNVTNQTRPNTASPAARLIRPRQRWLDTDRRGRGQSRSRSFAALVVLYRAHFDGWNSLTGKPAFQRHRRGGLRWAVMQRPTPRPRR